jgi:hypothetical protein
MDRYKNNFGRNLQERNKNDSVISKETGSRLG